MLDSSSVNKIEERSTAVLSAKDLRHLKKLIESCNAVKMYEMKCRPKHGGRLYKFTELFLLYILMEIRKTTFRGILSQVTDEYLKELGFSRGSDGKLHKPSIGTLNSFVNHVLPELCSEISKESACAVIKSEKNWLITIDSTPLEASIHSKCSQFNPHYSMKMDKMHILMINGKAVTGMFSEGTANDRLFASPLLNQFSECIPGIRRDTKVIADGGYDAFEIYADVYLSTSSILRCTGIRYDAVVSKEGNWKNIQRVYSKLKDERGFDAHKKNDEDFVLRFLCRNGRKILAGKYLRNLSMDLDQKEGRAEGRWVCESVHRAVKRWIRFDVRGLRSDTRHKRMNCRLLVMQLFSMIFKDYI